MQLTLFNIRWIYFLTVFHHPRLTSYEKIVIFFVFLRKPYAGSSRLHFIPPYFSCIIKTHNKSSYSYYNAERMGLSKTKFIFLPDILESPFAKKRKLSSRRFQMLSNDNFKSLFTHTHQNDTRGKSFRS